MRTTILLIGLISCFPASAATFKWVDENGVTHYGDTLPPQDVTRGRTEMNNKGQVVRKVDPALTPEQIKAQQAELAKQKDLDRQAEERRRRDQALLGTYTAEQDIDLARDRNAQQIDSTVRVARERVETSQTREKDLNRQLEVYQGVDKAGKPRVPPKELVEELEQTKKQQTVLTAVVVELQKQKESIIARFNDDKQRFLEIKQGGKASASARTRETKPDRTSVPFAINESSRDLVNECLARWTEGPANPKNYAASGELVQISDKTELVLDGRLQDKKGKFSQRRVVCPLTAEGKVDQQGIDIKKALASLGARY